VIQIEENEPDRLSGPLCLGDSLLKAIEEQCPVRQTGQGIVEGQKLQSFMEFLLLGNILWPF